MIRALPLVLLVALPALAVDPDPEPISSSQADLKKMQGTWDVIRIEERGVDRTKKGMSMTAIFKKDKIYVMEGNGKKEPATIKLDARKKPRHIDISPDVGKGELIKGIYQLHKDELTIVFTEGRQGRPKSFVSGKEQMKLVLKRRVAKK